MLFFLKEQNILVCGVSEEPLHMDRSSSILPAAPECPVHTERSLGPFCVASQLVPHGFACALPLPGGTLSPSSLFSHDWQLILVLVLSETSPLGEAFPGLPV